MLYLLFDDGSTKRVAQAVTATADKSTASLICRNGVGREVARFPLDKISLFSDHPLPPTPIPHVHGTFPEPLSRDRD